MLREATNTNFIVFGLNRSGLEHTIYRTLAIAPPMRLTWSKEVNSVEVFISRTNFEMQFFVKCSS